MLSVLLSYASGSMSLTDLLLEIFAFLVVIICCFPVHESAHAWMAERLGDSTGRLSGRINLNPAVHLTLWGTLCMVLFGFGYAKPVPVNIRNFPPKKRKQYFALTAAAGPLSNLILAIVSILIAYILLAVGMKAPSQPQAMFIGYSLFLTIAYINICLGVFNLIPIPPLDGSRLWTMLLPDRLYYKFLQYERYMMYILLGLIFLFNRIGFSPVGLLSDVIYNALVRVIGIPFGAVIG